MNCFELADYTLFRPRLSLTIFAIYFNKVKMFTGYKVNSDTTALSIKLAVMIDFDGIFSKQGE